MQVGWSRSVSRIEAKTVMLGLPCVRSLRVAGVSPWDIPFQMAVRQSQCQEASSKARHEPGSSTRTPCWCGSVPRGA